MPKKAQTLVIVESPTKAKTIGQFIGPEYNVQSSYGHVRDLPKSKLGIDVEHDFAPQYIIPRKAQKNVTALKKLAAKASRIILATDEDREGEAIAFHLVEALGLTEKKDQLARIVFHEITKNAITEALEHPRAIYNHLVDAQQARRVLDRLVGYKLSPFLWKKVARGLSAGRVQSVALRLIADREAEIAAFKPDEYWSIDATFAIPKSTETITAGLTRRDGVPLEKLEIESERAATAIRTDLEKSTCTVAHVEHKAMQRNPLAPFTTSTLQQESSRRLGFSSKKTMFLAQGLYERGLITYMRTDSVNLSREAVANTTAWIAENLPKEYRLPEARVFKTKSKLAQEAHEAIRPTDPHREAESLGLEKDEMRLYDLIWRRLIASQLPSAIFDTTRVDINAELPERPHAYTFSASGTTVRFDGFMRIWPAHIEETIMPKVTANTPVALETIAPLQHFTEPPPRYNEASLIKILEHYGVGRPSTYAPTISVIQERNYVEKRQGRFYPTEIGTLVNDVLKEHFPEIVDITFTASMEDKLDAVAEGTERWQDVIRTFYDPFAKHLEEKYESVAKKELVTETTTEVCDKCGKPMVVKFGRFGKFLACSGFPDCRNTKKLIDQKKSTGVICTKCLESEDRKQEPGELIERRVSKGRARGRIFWGCSKYPACDYATWTNPAGPKKDAEEVPEAPSTAEAE